MDRLEWKILPKMDDFGCPLILGNCHMDFVVIYQFNMDLIMIQIDLKILKFGMYMDLPMTFREVTQSTFQYLRIKHWEFHSNIGISLWM